MNNSPQLALALQDTGDALSLLGDLIIAGDRTNGLNWGRAAALLEGAAARIRATHAPGSGVSMNSDPSDDCYAKALKGEPTFTLLARDDSSPELVEEWARHRAGAVERGERPSEDNNKVVQAYAKAIAMREWRRDNFALWRPAPLPEAEVE